MAGVSSDWVPRLNDRIMVRTPAAGQAGSRINPDESRIVFHVCRKSLHPLKNGDSLTTPHVASIRTAVLCRRHHPPMATWIRFTSITWRWTSSQRPSLCRRWLLRRFGDRTAPGRPSSHGFPSGLRPWQLHLLDFSETRCSGARGGNDEGFDWAGNHRRGGSHSEFCPPPTPQRAS